MQQGFEVDVYEQAPKLEEVGAGVQLSPNGTRALHALGVLKGLEKLSCMAEGKKVRHWKTGETGKLFDLGALVFTHISHTGSSADARATLRQERSRPGRFSSNVGSMWVQSPVATGQRVCRTHPVGRSIGLGISPRSCEGVRR